MIETIFTVKNQDLERLSPEEAVSFFSELIWAEARRTGVPISKVNISSRIDVPDGGIDATVEDNIALQDSDLIKIGRTSYQLKASSEFKPWQKSEIKKELLDSKGKLGSSITDCLNENGNYILVCFRQDPNDKEQKSILENIKECFVNCGYPDPKVEVWGQNKLQGFLKVFPSLALKLKGRGEYNFQTHKSWSQNSDMQEKFIAGQEQKQLILDIQDELRKDNTAIHIRILGDPGIGKTRIVLEATGTEDLAPLVIYCDRPSSFMDSQLMGELLMDDNDFSVILVMDECNLENSRLIWNKLQSRGPRLKFISIHNEYETFSGNVSRFNVPLLQKDEICNIIEGYGLSKDQADRWSEFCDGSPRVAHILGYNLQHNPEDLLKSPDAIWDRYTIRGDDPKSNEVEERKWVLRYISLFRKFGFGHPMDNEAKAIAKMVNNACPQITWERFQLIIQNLRRWKILQGDYTLYMTPKALHIKFWIDWWDIFGNSFDFEEFSNQLTPQLREWFYEMFKYARESELAYRITTQLLNEDGPIQKNDYLRDKLGASFLLALAESNPEHAVKCLKNTIGTWSKEELIQFTTGRRQIVWALEKIAMWRELFSDAARLLMILGEVENERLGNNASGVFAALFSPGPGHVAPTEASPQERFPILKEALESESREKRLLALRACNEALQTDHFVRMTGNERQGLRKEPEFWVPKTYGELFDAYRIVWEFLLDRLDDLPNNEQQEALDILIRHIGGLGRIHELTDMVIDSIRQLSKKPYVNSRKMLVAITNFLKLRGKELPPDIFKRWEQAQKELTGGDFASRIKRHVGISMWEILDDDSKDQIPEKIMELANEALKNKDSLRVGLDWLMTEEAKEGHTFGYTLGKLDQNYSMLPELLTAQRNHTHNTSVYLIGGYLKALFESEPGKWEEILDDIAEDEKLKTWLPEISWRSGASDKSSLRILRLAEKGDIDILQSQIPVYGGIGISEDVFKKWISFLLGHRDVRAAYKALDWYHFYYIRKDSKYVLPEDLSIQLILHKSFYEKSNLRFRSQLDDYHWTQIALEFIKLYPAKILDIANVMLEHFEEDGTIFEGFSPQPNEVLIEIAKQHPHEVWNIIIKYLGPPIDSRAFRITHWLRGRDVKYHHDERPPLTLFHLEDIWAWVDMDVEKRAWYLASFVPKELSKKEGCLARELLIRYGDRKDVRSNLISNFETGVFSGEASLHFQRLKEGLNAFRDTEENENVRKWIDEYTEILDSQIEQWKIREEREF